MEKLNRGLRNAESREESVRQRSMLHDPFEPRERNRRSSSKIEFLRLMDSLMKQNKEISLKVIESSQKVLEMNNDDSNDEEDIEETNRLRELIDKKNSISKKVDSTRDKIIASKESPAVCQSVEKPTRSGGKSTTRRDNKVDSDEDEESENIGRDQIDTNNSMNSAASMEEFVQQSYVVCKPVKPPVEMQITATMSGRITKIEPKREEFVTKDYMGRCNEGEFIEEGICNLSIASKESPTKEDIKRMQKTIYYIVRRIRDHESSARGSAYYIQRHKVIDIAGKGRFFVCDLFCYAYGKARCKSKIRFEYNIDKNIYKIFMVGEHNHSFDHRNAGIGKIWDAKFENMTSRPAFRVLRTNIIDDDDEKSDDQSDEMTKRSEDTHNLDKYLSLESRFPEIKTEPL